MGNFGPKPRTSPFGKMSIFRLFKLFLFYSLGRRFFLVEYHKTHLPGLYSLKKKRWKNGQFWTKTMD